MAQPSLWEMYAKFGETAEAAQLPETQLGNLLVELAAGAHGGETEPELVLRALLAEVDRKTLGQLIRKLHASTQFADTLVDELSEALAQRNRLNHSFFREHNFRRNSGAGRAHMVADLQVIHSCLIRAYRATLLLSGIDLEKAKVLGLPTEHLDLRLRERRDDA